MLLFWGFSMFEYSLLERDIVNPAEQVIVGYGIGPLICKITAGSSEIDTHLAPLIVWNILNRINEGVLIKPLNLQIGAGWIDPSAQINMSGSPWQIAAWGCERLPCVVWEYIYPVYTAVGTDLPADGINLSRCYSRSEN